MKDVMKMFSKVFGDECIEIHGDYELMGLHYGS
jgi:hypothetical protein